MSHFNLEDVHVIEDDDDPDPVPVAVALQRAINDGLWGLQGSYGRAMMDAIEAGMCMLGPTPAQDYYGNRIPSRDEVKPGTKGSREYVAAARGAGWAAMLEDV